MRVSHLRSCKTSSAIIASSVPYALVSVQNRNDKGQAVGDSISAALIFTNMSQLTAIAQHVLVHTAI